MHKTSLKPVAHLAPDRGWLNDPNGLCAFGGVRHIFFQYAPDYPASGPKGWGHYATKNFKDYTFYGMALSPDNELDKNGVYSGGAIVKDGVLHLFYTGNVKLAGDYDYVTAGRLATVFKVTSADGVYMSPKKVLLKNCDYPPYYSCHVRDPKVWREGDEYFMLLGGRTRQDKGALLVYRSADLENWSFYRDYVFDDLGYMLECPDRFVLDGKVVHAFCPQGVEAEGENFRNLFSSGYCAGDICRANYTEWDKGYDFYAPQTFEDGGRTILVGWAGIADEKLPYSYDQSLSEGWIHCLTTFRKLSYSDGKIYCFPIEEILSLATGYSPANETQLSTCFARVTVNGEAKITLCGCFEIAVEDGRVNFCFTNHSCGRPPRSLTVDARELFIFLDRSIAEIYINGGEYVFTTRIFSGQGGLVCKGKADCRISGVQEFSYEKTDGNR